jgi:hypothetical protein
LNNPKGSRKSEFQENCLLIGQMSTGKRECIANVLQKSEYVRTFSRIGENLILLVATSTTMALFEKDAYCNEKLGLNLIM